MPELFPPGVALPLALAAPLLCSAGVGVLGARPNLRDGWTVVVSIVTFLAVGSLWRPVAAGEPVELDLWPMLDGVALGFSVEPLGLLFGLVASGLWILTSIYAFGYMRGHHEKNQTRFFVCFAAAIAAALGIAFSRNLLTLFLFYEALTFSTYPLVTHHETEEARRAGRVYLGVLVSTSIGFLLLAVISTWRLTGTLELTAGGILGDVSDRAAWALLLLFVFGIAKAALMPFHRWLPAAMVAPTPVSALLHAVAVVKAGVFAVLKVALYVFGLERLRELGTGLLEGTGPLLLVASFTVLSASVVALFQDNLKRRLAYSTISQLSYIVIGAMLATSAGALGAGLHVLTHALGKITLFFCAGAIMVAAHETEISRMGGLGRRMPFTFLAFLLASISIIGLPPFAGAWSKWFLLLGAYQAERDWVVWVLLLSSLLNVAYLLPIPVAAFFGSAASAKRPDHDDGDADDGEDAGDADDADETAADVHEAPWLCVGPLLATAILCVVVFVWIDPWIALLERIAQ
ncbi:MAG TPA: proton-conducting transporter membrane subunit [Thermoanaerobaculia bacterium]|nr:proton-conducting transporter membrane subunit [Thermoanaerobaculia bacterium]